MPSLFLNRLDSEKRKALITRLHESQAGNCFICEAPVDLDLHADSVDIDHVEPLSAGGKDDETNLALAHAACNRSKQASDLRVARVLARFEAIRADVLKDDQRGANLSDVLGAYGGSKHSLKLGLEGDTIRYSLPEVGDNSVRSAPVYRDGLSDLDYCFMSLPIEYLHHDDRINPRNIGGNLGKLVTEFHKGRPQLHPGLAWTSIDNGAGTIKVFDGQHKAAAQVLLGARQLPVRIFLDPDPDLLLETNTNAGTTLRQVAFDKSVQRRLGSTLFRDRLETYRADRNLAEDATDFSEADLVVHFKGESREMRRYILDNQRNAITQHPENKLTEFMDYGGKGQEKPLSYNTIDKTFYSFFIYPGMLETSLDHGDDSDSNPRDLEIEQIVQLMSVIAEEIYIDRFDPVLGTRRIENKIQKGEDMPEGHLTAFRMSKEEILYVWLQYVQQIVKQHFFHLGEPINEDRLFQNRFSSTLWDQLRTYIRSLKGLPLWVNRDLSATVFGGKQNYEFWKTIFQTGKTPQGQQVLASPINLVDMIQGSSSSE